MHDAKFQYGSDDKLIHREDGSEVPADEPIFAIRGKDEVGVYAIAEYVRVMEQYADKSRLAREHADAARKALGRIIQWQIDNPDRVGMGCHTCEHVEHRLRLTDIGMTVPSC